MLGLHLKNLLSIIPLLFVLSIIVFLLRFATPQDPVEQSLGLFQQLDSEALPYTIEQYESKAIELGLDKDLFYFSFQPNYITAEAKNLLLPLDKNIAKTLLKNGCKWKDIKSFISLKNNSPDNLLLTQIATDLTTNGNTSIDYSHLPQKDQSTINSLIGKPRQGFYYPVLRWHGADNQYHHWISGFFSAKKLRSIQNNSLVIPKIARALAWTLSIAFLSILTSYSLGVFIGFKQVSSAHNRWNKVQVILDFFYTMPHFWIATLAIVFLTTSEYGKWTNIFPSVHSINFNGDFILIEIIKNFKHLLLPIFCISIHSIGFLSSMMADNLKNQLSKPYFLTAKQKGLSRAVILKNHGFKNAIFPILTMLTNVIPATFSGSLISEIIFNVPGVGRLLYNSILQADWNVVFPIVLLAGIITSVSFWFSDILYAKFDPRVNTSSI